MTPPQIPPPRNVPREPDPATQKFPDFTSRTAESRILYLNLGFFRYGTNDKVHAAAVTMSLVLLLVNVALIFIGLFREPTDWHKTAFQWTTNTFLFVAGFALGTSGSSRSGNGDQDE